MPIFHKVHKDLFYETVEGRIMSENHRKIVLGVKITKDCRNKSNPLIDGKDQVGKRAALIDCKPCPRPLQHTAL
jgi:hypothetical protein